MFFVVCKYEYESIGNIVMVFEDRLEAENFCMENNLKHLDRHFFITSDI